jgi:hypothetical protein
MIARLLGLLFDFGSGYDLRVLSLLSKFIEDEEIGEQCLSVLVNALALEMSNDDQEAFAAIVDAAVDDANHVLANTDSAPQTAELADAFLAAYDGWKKRGG